MKRINLLLTTVAFLMTTALFAQELIVDAEKVNQLAQNPEIAILDAGKASDYNNMHIMNSLSTPHTELYQEGAIEGLLKTPEELAEYFGKKGITENTKIIIYDDGSQKYNSRLLWILKYIGAKDVSLLHKDMNQWRKARVKLTRKPGNKPAATFHAKEDKALIATMDEVIKAINDDEKIIVDARPAEEFKGGTHSSKGHIKTAININYEDFLTESGAYKSKEEIAKVAAAKGLSPDKEVIAYCTSSVRAGVIYVALKEILGYRCVKVYDGAYNEIEKKHPELIVG
jgi:thiosulfate/3-mercaptopyruvate sulfurtransferase